MVTGGVPHDELRRAARLPMRGYKRLGGLDGGSSHQAEETHIATIPEIEARTSEESVALGWRLTAPEAEKPPGDGSTHVLEVLHIPARDAQRFMQQARESRRLSRDTGD